MTNTMGKPLTNNVHNDVGIKTKKAVKGNVKCPFSRQNKKIRKFTYF